MIYMVCYDISDPKRLRRAAKTLENFGLRIQKSFFQCEISRPMRKTLETALLEVIDTEQDYLYFYPLCDDCTRRAITLGTGEVVRLEPFEIL